MNVALNIGQVMNFSFKFTISKKKIEKPNLKDLSLDINLLVKDAIKEGDPDKMKLRDGMTLLHYVIGAVEDKDDRYDFAKQLMDWGANVNKPNDRGDTPFHYALEKDDDFLFDLCVSKGADIRKKNSQMNAPLFCAIVRGNLRRVKILLEIGVNPNVKSNPHVSTLTAAVMLQNIEMIRLLLIHKANPNDRKAVYMAAATSQVEVLYLLIENGANLQEFNFGQKRTRVKCWLGLHVLARRTGMIAFLLENEVDMKMDNHCVLTVAYTYYEFLKGVEDKTYLEFEKVLNVIIAHVVHIVLIGDRELIIHEVMRIIEKKRFLKDIFDRHLKQLEWMKDCKVRDGFNVTYLDLMTKTGDEFLKHCNEEILETFSECNLSVAFPDYTDRLRRNIDRGKFYKKARKHFQQWFSEFLNGKLPFDLICYICDFLVLEDLRIFILHEPPEHELDCGKVLAREMELPSVIIDMEEEANMKIGNLYAAVHSICNRVYNN